MRRRPPPLGGLLPAELTDSRLWPLCPRFDGGEQRCVCWWAGRQCEFLESGGEWPGGEHRELTDLLEMLDRFPCREPWSDSQI
jgi:hypothetical protein